MKNHRVTISNEKNSSTKKILNGKQYFDNFENPV